MRASGETQGDSSVRKSENEVETRSRSEKRPPREEMEIMRLARRGGKIRSGG